MDSSETDSPMLVQVTISHYGLENVDIQNASQKLLIFIFHFMYGTLNLRHFKTSSDACFPQVDMIL